MKKVLNVALDMSDYSVEGLPGGYSLLRTNSWDASRPSEVLVSPKSEPLVEKYLDQNGAPSNGIYVVDRLEGKVVYAAGGQVIGSGAAAEARTFVLRVIAGGKDLDISELSSDGREKVSEMVKEGIGGLSSPALTEAPDAEAFCEAAEELARGRSRLAAMFIAMSRRAFGPVLAMNLFLGHAEIAISGPGANEAKDLGQAHVEGLQTRRLAGIERAAEKLGERITETMRDSGYAYSANAVGVDLGPKSYQLKITITDPKTHSYIVVDILKTPALMNVERRVGRPAGEDLPLSLESFADAEYQLWAANSVKDGLP